MMFKVLRAIGIGRKIIPGYNDLIMPFDSAKVPAANAPTWAPFQGNLNAYTFGINDYFEFSVEFVHGYKLGTNFYPHVHWVINGTDGTDRAVNWELEYTFANMDASDGVGNSFPSTTTISVEQTIPADTPDRTHMFIELPTITGTGNSIGAYLKGRIRRIIATGTAPSSDPFGLALGIHIEEDTIGSKLRASK